MAASTVGWSYTHTSVQCNPASVGLAQARPNYIHLPSFLVNMNSNTSSPLKNLVSETLCFVFDTKMV